MRFPYIEKPPSSGFLNIFPGITAVYKPLITVVLRNGDKKQKIFALVDSGADACLFPKGVGEQLGIDIRGGQRMDFTGLGGNRSPFYFHEIEILLGQYHVKTKIGFSNSYHIGMSGILGQLGFFDKFAVSFDHKNKFVEIRKPSLFQELTSKISLNVL